MTVEEKLVQAGDPFPYHQPNQLFRNISEGDRIQFEPYPGTESGPFSVSQVSRGAAFGDLDNDGDLDVVISNNSGSTQVLQNQVGQENNWIGLQLKTKANGPNALGAAISLVKHEGESMLRRVRTSGSYVSANDPRVLFGLGSMPDSREVEIVVHWVNNDKELFGPLAVREYHQVVRGQGRPYSTEQ